MAEWQTHMTQNHAGNRVGSTPTFGTNNNPVNVYFYGIIQLNFSLSGKMKPFVKLLRNEIRLWRVKEFVMALVAAKCTECGANVEVDDSKKTGICRHCGTLFILQEAITNYNTYITLHTTQSKVAFANGGRYEGEFKDGNRHGRGIEYFSDGSRYEGEFKDNQRHGRGIECYADGGRYEGEFKDNEKHGRGIEHSANGHRYEGEFRNNKIIGRGILYFTNGGRYEGEFKDGNRHGRGIEYFSDGGRYEGEFKDNQRHGHGIEYDANGGRYEGSFQNDQRHGRGTVYNSKEEVVESGIFLYGTVFK